jgi:hypothetical protein
MFNLNEQIKKWRANLNTSQSFKTIDIDELENHLIEEIEKLKLSGLSEEEAFIIATHRLGQIDSLSDEFVKVNTGILWRKRFFWSGIIILVWIVIGFIRNAVSQIVLFIAAIIGARGYELNIVNSFSQIILFVLAALALFFMTRLENINRLFYRIINNFRGKVILFFAVFIITVTTLALGILSTALNARLLSSQDFGQMAMFNSIVSRAWAIFMPMILLSVIILLRPSKLRKSEI